MTHLMDMTYYLDDCYVEAHAGRLNQEVAVRGDENELLWIDFDHIFFDSSKFAGEGNIGHILEHVALHSDRVLL